MGKLLVLPTEIKQRSSVANNNDADDDAGAGELQLKKKRKCYEEEPIYEMKRQNSFLVASFGLSNRSASSVRSFESSSHSSTASSSNASGFSVSFSISKGKYY